MPNHLHGVIAVEAADAARQFSLPDFVQQFKAITTHRYADGVAKRGWPRFDGRLWQRGYYERVVRDDQALDRIRRYVAANPARWAYDRENPHAVSPMDD